MSFDITKKVTELFPHLVKTFNILRASLTALDACERELARMDSEEPPEDGWSESDILKRDKRVDEIMTQYVTHRDFLFTHCIAHIVHEDFATDKGNGKELDSSYGPVMRELFKLVNQKMEEAVGEVPEPSKIIQMPANKIITFDGAA